MLFLLDDILTASFLIIDEKSGVINPMAHSTAWRNVRLSSWIYSMYSYSLLPTADLSPWTTTNAKPAI
jgi:hypothetical protein